MTRIADLFSGMGSFHRSGDKLGMETVFACDINPDCRKFYEQTYGLTPASDITHIDPVDIPDHDILAAGFPCQPFSNIGQRKGVDDTRGRLIDYVVGILDVKRPRFFVLENVRGLLSVNGGETFREFIDMLTVAGNGYVVKWKVLRADEFGIPQMRKRVFIVGCDSSMETEFQFPEHIPTPSLGEFLGYPVVRKTAFTIRCGGRRCHVDDRRNWDSYRLDDGSVRTLTVENCEKLQGFDDGCCVWGDLSQTVRYKMLGNTIPTCLTYAVLESIKKMTNETAEDITP